jgi:ferredoxin
MRPVQPRSEIAVVDLDVCDRCGLCLPLCPPEAIHLALDDLLHQMRSKRPSEQGLLGDGNITRPNGPYTGPPLV